MADYITIVSDATIKDLSGANLANGVFSIMATDDEDNPIPVRIGTATAQALNQPVKRTITNGALTSSIQVPNPTSTDPSPIYFRITITDLDQDMDTVYRKVQIIDQGAGSWNFATMQTGLSVGAIVSYVVGPKGDKGDTGSSGVDSPKSLALLSQVQPAASLKNLFNAAAAQVGYINGADGTFVSLAGYYASDFMPANAGGMMATAQALYKSTSASVAFYSQDKSYLGQLSTGVLAGGTFSIPLNVYFIRTTQQVGSVDLPTQMIVFGVTLPSSYQAFGTYPSNVIDAKVATLSSTLATQITTGQTNKRYGDSQLRNKMFPGVNYFDSTATTSGYVGLDGTIVAASGYVTSDFIPCNAGGQMVLNRPMTIGSSAPCYYDENYAFISFDSNVAYRTAGTPMTAAPRTAAYVRFSLATTDVAGAMFQYGTVASSSFIPFGFSVTASQLTTAANNGRYLDAQLRNKMFPGVNFFDSTATTPGYVGLDGTIVAASGYVTSDYIPANAGGQMVLNRPMTIGSSAPCYYDENKVFISFDSNVAYRTAGTPMTAAPRTVAYIRFSMASTDVAGAMFQYGTVASSTFIPYGYAATVSQLTTAANNRRYIDAQLRNKAFPGINYFDVAAATTTGYLGLDGNIVAASGYTTTDFIPANAGAQMVCNKGMIIGAAAVCYYDENKVFISFDVNTAYRTAGTPLAAAPLAATYVRFSIATVDAATMMFQYGAVAGSTYKPYGYVVPPVAAVTAATVSPLNGKKIAIWGDSISSIFGNAWQNVLTTRGGCTVGFQDARPGRQMGQIFECYGGSPTGTNQGSVSTPNGPYQNTGTVGNTLAQDLATCDIGIIFLGTNNYGSTDGAYGDPITAATNYGWVRAALEGVLTAAPGMRLVFVTNQMRTSETIARAEALANIWETVCRDYAVPVLNLTKVGGVNLQTQSTLLADGLHPSTLGFTKFLGPAIAQFVQQHA